MNNEHGMSNVKVLKCILALAALVGLFLAMEQYTGSARSAFGIWIALFLLVLIAAIVVARRARSLKQAILPMVIAFLAAMQLHMLLSLGAMSVPYFLAAILACIVGVCIGIVGFFWMAVRLFRKRELKGPARLVCIPFLFIAIFICGEFTRGLQRHRNERNGTIIGKVIARYHKDNGHYPPDLSALKGAYLDDFPKWRCGLASFNYIYWVDTWSTGEEVNLKFLGGPGTGVFYVFGEDRWYGSTVP